MEDAGTASLPMAGQLLVWGMRRWVLAVCRREPATLVTARPYEKFGCGAAVPLLDEMMTLLTATAHRQVALRCLGHPTLGADEALLLGTVRSLQDGREPAARTLIEGLVPTRLTRTFCRPAGDFAAELRRAGLSLRAPPRLRVVGTCHHQEKTA